MKKYTHFLVVLQFVNLEAVLLQEGEILQRERVSEKQTEKKRERETERDTLLIIIIIIFITALPRSFLSIFYSISLPGSIIK